MYKTLNINVLYDMAVQWGLIPKPTLHISLFANNNRVVGLKTKENRYQFIDLILI